MIWRTERVEGEPLQAQGWEVTPVLRVCVRGWVGRRAGGASIVFLPAEVLARRGEHTLHLHILDRGERAIQLLLLAALVAPLLCLLVQWRGRRP